ncbi:MAG: hypothetical protein Ct9H300mP11_18080 [Chloroflexota bacterium]|nr:MAG: hypothetical protein Ct9H300mP11_18080 [Chloroflexota bacterium]
MGEKLLQGDRLPKVGFQLLDGRTITLPDDAPTRYTALLSTGAIGDLTAIGS